MTAAGDRPEVLECVRNATRWVQQGEYGQAREALVTLPDGGLSPTLEVAVAELLSATGDVDSALSRLARQRDENEHADAAAYAIELDSGRWSRCRAPSDDDDRSLQRWLRATKMHSLVRDHRGALHCAQHAAALRPQEPALLLELARLAIELGDNERGLRHARAALEQRADPEIVAHLMLRLGRPKVATKLLSVLESRASALATRAMIHNWRGEHVEATALARRALRHDADLAAAHRELAVTRLVAGDLPGCEEELQSALSVDESDADAWVWRAELSCRRRAFAEALDALHRAIGLRGGEHPLALVMHHVVSLRHDDGVGESDGADVKVNRRKVREEFAGIVHELVPERLSQLGTSGAATLSVLEECLRRVGANRSSTVTRCDTGELRVLTIPAPPRAQARRALELIRLLPVSRVFAELDSLCAADPSSPVPVVHRGELHLWLGQLDEADRDFEAAISLDAATRWAYIGRQGTSLLRGDADESLRQCERGIEAMGGTEGPTLQTYRGEAHYLRGNHQRALEDLSMACRRHPRRLGAWVALGRVQLTMGESDEATHQHIRDRAPGLFNDACRSAGLEPWNELDDGQRLVFYRQALELMRGNRSSSCLTYVVGDEVRVVPHSRVVTTQASRIRRAAALATRAVERLS